MAVKLNFRYAGRPKWLGLKYRAGKPLTDTGRLKDSSTMYDNDTALVGTISSMPLFITSVGRLGATAKFDSATGILTLTDDDKQALTDDVQIIFRI